MTNIQLNKIENITVATDSGELITLTVSGNGLYNEDCGCVGEVHQQGGTISVNLY
jgi:hypothetical protein